MSITAACVGQLGTVQSKNLGARGFIHGLIHALNVLPPSKDSQTSISHAPKSTLGSLDFHATLTVCPGRTTWPRAGEISLAEYAPVCALEVRTNCGAKPSATANSVNVNMIPRIFISRFPPISPPLS